MTTVRKVQPKAMKPGHCAVCGMPVILKWRDSELGHIGDCCFGAVVLADKALMAARIVRPEGQFRED